MLVAPTPDPPYLSGESGTLGPRATAVGRARDVLADVLDAPRRMAVRDSAQLHPPMRRVLVLGVERSERRRTMLAARKELFASRHEVTMHTARPAPGKGKWENLNALLEEHGPGSAHDWLLIVDDDVTLPKRFLDTFLFCAERHDLVLAQPAHRFASHAAWRMTRRRPGSVVRESRFVEIGPVTAMRQPALAALLPFPQLKMGWGLDAHWGAVARDNGWPIGIVDLTPVRHLVPVASAYPREEAIAEAEAFLAERPYVTAEEARRIVRVHREWR